MHRSSNELSPISLHRAHFSRRWNTHSWPLPYWQALHFSSTAWWGDTQQVTLPKRLELIRNSSNSFWRTWSKTYLNQLQLRHKWQATTKNLVVGQVVFVKEDTPPFQPLGVIEATYPGPDKLVRIVEVRIRGRRFKRPNTKIVSLHYRSRHRISPSLPHVHFV